MATVVQLPNRRPQLAALNDAPNDVLALGSRGTLVSSLQVWLHKRGFTPGAIDGIYGPNTASAVRNLQRVLRAIETGNFDAQTVVAVKSDLGQRQSVLRSLEEDNLTRAMPRPASTSTIAKPAVTPNDQMPAPMATEEDPAIQKRWMAIGIGAAALGVLGLVWFNDRKNSAPLQGEDLFDEEEDDLGATPSTGVGRGKGGGRPRKYAAGANPAVENHLRMAKVMREFAAALTPGKSPAEMARRREMKRESIRSAMWHEANAAFHRGEGTEPEPFEEVDLRKYAVDEELLNTWPDAPSNFWEPKKKYDDTDDAPAARRGKRLVFDGLSSIDHRDQTMTDAKMRKLVKSYGLSVKRVDSEYRLNYPKGREETAYYSDDREDIVNTARDMANRESTKSVHGLGDNPKSKMSTCASQWRMTTDKTGTYREFMKSCMKA